MAENPYQSMPQSTGATSSGGSDLGDWAKIIAQLYGSYSASKPGKFQQVPEDPALAALRARILGFIDKSPTRDAFGQMVGQRLQQNNANPYQLPPAKYGYQPYAGNSNAPKYDLSKILPTLYGNSNPTGTPTATPPPTQPPPTGGSNTGGASGGTGGAIEPQNGTDKRLPNMSGDTGSLIGGATVFDPNMLGRDPNQNPNNKPGPYGSPSDGGIDLPGMAAAVAGSGWWKNYTSAHPNWKTDLAGAASVVAGAMGNLPISIALKIVQMFLPKQTTPPPTQPVTPQVGGGLF